MINSITYYYNSQGIVCTISNGKGTQKYIKGILIIIIIIIILIILITMAAGDRFPPAAWRSDWEAYGRKRGGVVRTWEKAKLTIYIVTWYCLALPNMDGKRRGKCSIWDSLLSVVSVSLAGEDPRRGLVKRASAFHGRKPSGRMTLRWTLTVSETVLRVYCTGLCTGLLSYVSRK
jgi:hypothetical protein